MSGSFQRKNTAEKVLLGVVIDGNKVTGFQTKRENGAYVICYR